MTELTKKRSTVEEITQTICLKIAEFFQIEPTEITPQSSFRDDLRTSENHSKLFFLEFIIEIEKFFSIVLPDEEIRKMQTVENLTSVVCKRKGLL